MLFCRIYQHRPARECSGISTPTDPLKACVARNPVVFEPIHHSPLIRAAPKAVSMLLQKRLRLIPSGGIHALVNVNLLSGLMARHQPDSNKEG
jgi:hypothetical protein